MKKKLLAGFFMLAIAVLSVAQVLTLTWTSCTITMHTGTVSVVSIGQYLDCAATIPIDSWDWDGVSQGNTYQLHVYVKNKGTEKVFLTYLTDPIELSFYGDKRAACAQHPGVRRTLCSSLATPARRESQRAEKLETGGAGMGLGEKG